MAPAVVDFSEQAPKQRKLIVCEGREACTTKFWSTDDGQFSTLDGKFGPRMVCQVCAAHYMAKHAARVKSGQAPTTHMDCFTTVDQSAVAKATAKAQRGEAGRLPVARSNNRPSTSTSFCPPSPPSTLTPKKKPGYQPEHDGYLPISAIQKLKNSQKGVDLIRLDLWIKTSKGNGTNRSTVHHSLFANVEVPTTITVKDLKAEIWRTLKPKFNKWSHDYPILLSAFSLMSGNTRELDASHLPQDALAIFDLCYNAPVQKNGKTQVHQGTSKLVGTLKKSLLKNDGVYLFLDPDVVEKIFCWIEDHETPNSDDADDEPKQKGKQRTKVIVGYDSPIEIDSNSQSEAESEIAKPPSKVQLRTRAGAKTRAKVESGSDAELAKPDPRKPVSKGKRKERAEVSEAPTPKRIKGAMQAGSALEQTEEEDQPVEDGRSVVATPRNAMNTPSAGSSATGSHPPAAPNIGSKQKSSGTAVLRGQDVHGSSTNPGSIFHSTIDASAMTAALSLQGRSMDLNEEAMSSVTVPVTVFPLNSYTLLQLIYNPEALPVSVDSKKPGTLQIGKYLAHGKFKVTKRGVLELPGQDAPLFASSASNSDGLAVKELYRVEDGRQRPLLSEKAKIGILEEATLNIWGTALMEEVYSRVDKILGEKAAPDDLPIPRLRFVEAAIAKTHGPNPRYYLLEELMESSPGAFIKYIHNGSSQVAISDDQPSDLRTRAQFMAFAQHAQYEFSSKTVFVSDFQGSDDLLTDPQLITRPDTDKGKRLFSNGNVTSTFARFEAEHRCNEYCKFFDLGAFVLDSATETPEKS